MSKPLLIAMAGLPGSGKSALAVRLAAALPAVILNKDTVRAAVFPPPETEYTSVQDDFVLSLMYQAAGWLLHKGRTVIIDGRTFTRRNQRIELHKASVQAGVELRIIYCYAPDEIVRSRLEKDMAADEHPAKDRNFDLYLQRKATIDPIEEPHLELNTDANLEVLTERALEWLKLPI
jgi:adenylylsulfate kinase